MNENNMTNERLKSLFTTHPSIDVFYITADGMPFFDKYAAASHAQRLFDKGVLELSRDEVEYLDHVALIDVLKNEYVATQASELHPSIEGPYQEFLKTEGGADTVPGSGVIVPASDILAGETPAAPAVAEGPPAPAIVDTPATPAVDETPATPAVVEGPPAPAVVATPVIVDTPATPAVVETPAAPAIVDTTAIDLTPLQIAEQTPVEELTTYQKGLLTKSRNAAAAAMEGETK
jgi:hypothetical protein